MTDPTDADRLASIQEYWDDDRADAYGTIRHQVLWLLEQIESRDKRIAELENRCAACGALGSTCINVTGCGQLDNCCEDCTYKDSRHD